MRAWTRWFTLLLLLASACRSTERWKPTGPPLAFHAALAPTVVEEKDPSAKVALALEDGTRSVTEGSGSNPASASDDGMRIAFEGQEVSQILSELLAEYGFTRVTLLAPPAAQASSAEAPGTLGAPGAPGAAFEREALEGPQPAVQAPAWQDLALEAGADILISTLLVYEPRVHGRINEKFWLNLPLFLFGPLCYLVGDNTYEVEVSLLAELYDVSQRRREVLEWRLMRIPIQVNFSGTDLSFLRRSGGRLSSYALSLLIPVGLLARQSDHIASQVRAAVLEELAQGLVRELHSRRDEIESGPNPSRPSVDARRVRTERQADGTLVVELPVLDSGFVARGWSLQAGAARVSGEFDGSATKKSAAGEWQIEARLDAPADARYLRAAIEDGSGRVRRYTFALSTPSR